MFFLHIYLNSVRSLLEKHVFMFLAYHLKLETTTCQMLMLFQRRVALGFDTQILQWPCFYCVTFNCKIFFSVL
jgi:hypothetical protein